VKKLGDNGLNFWMMIQMKNFSFLPKRHVRKDGSIWYHLRDGKGSWIWENKKRRNLNE